MASRDQLPRVYLARHGETSWAITGQHTGLTDLPLTERGERNAKRLQQRLEGIDFKSVLTSPLQRAKRTAELAGFGGVAVINPDLVEWDYGDYEGKTTAEIRQTRPDWEIFRDGCPNGETVKDVAIRAERIIAQTRTVEGNMLIFSSSHFLRVLVACWQGMTPTAGRHFILGTAAVSILGYDHNLQEPAVHLWNDCGHLTE